MPIANKLTLDKSQIIIAVQTYLNDHVFKDIVVVQDIEISGGRDYNREVQFEITLQESKVDA